ncbi:MAG: 2-oxoacid:ferredoxin oxidoreductase subunit beta [Deferribacteres bacterium]|nr:2-oxoacid:ferredoxin oxidoreductase subunit beta [candidate division KSB1 bacterium]MCB9503457.1 2-oxoacid:ferredoxin oxidoreductase subunit beta [Deferribacteres bacterium]
MEPIQLTKDDFTSNQETRWCPGCGDYSILAQMKKVLPTLGIPRENFVFVSGIGCSSRFPYYLETYGIHGIHGRAPVIASGVKLANPNLKVFVITGDGDGLSIGGNHLIHLFRRNIDITIVLFNNQIYGLTKGQYSPTSEKGKITKSSPYGSLESPFNPVQMALASGASFVARSIDRDPKHLEDTLARAAKHKGTAFVEVYQNCNIFNDGAFLSLTEPKEKKKHLLKMEHGKPFIYGENDELMLTWTGKNFKVVNKDLNENGHEILTHDENGSGPAMEFMLASLSLDAQLPTPIGIFRAVERDTYDDMMAAQMNATKKKKGEGDLKTLFTGGYTWTND